MHYLKYLTEGSKKANIILKGKRNYQIMLETNLGIECKDEEKHSLWLHFFQNGFIVSSHCWEVFKCFMHM